MNDVPRQVVTVRRWNVAVLFALLILALTLPYIAIAHEDHRRLHDFAVQNAQRRQDRNAVDLQLCNDANQRALASRKYIDDLLALAARPPTPAQKDRIDKLTAQDFPTENCRQLLAHPPTTTTTRRP